MSHTARRRVAHCPPVRSAIKSPTSVQISANTQFKRVLSVCHKSPMTVHQSPMTVHQSPASEPHSHRALLDTWNLYYQLESREAYYLQFLGERAAEADLTILAAALRSSCWRASGPMMSAIASASMPASAALIASCVRKREGVGGEGERQREREREREREQARERERERERERGMGGR